MHFLNKRILLSLSVISLVTLSFVGEASNNSTYAQAATESLTFVGPYEPIVLPPLPALVRAWNQSSRLVYGNPRDFPRFGSMQSLIKFMLIQLVNMEESS